MSKRQRPLAAIKRTIRQQAGGRCEYCRSPVDYSPDPFSTEHIIPQDRGGTNELANLALSCLGCNNHKHTAVEATDPVSGEIVSLFHPRLERWEDHFRWSEDFTLVVGKTPTGRATIERLKLNREGVINLRRVLSQMGEHPPD
jgi:5-methylcytosine-specific restriction endonuclease McrA